MLSSMCSFLKDLATLRDPASKYTFLSYLHSLEPSRLLSFISRSTFEPTRREFADYLAWAARKAARELAQHSTGLGGVAYGERVTAVDALVESDGADKLVRVLRIASEDSQTRAMRTRLARNVVLATGGRPRLPRQLAHLDATVRLVHSSAFLECAPETISAAVDAYVASGSKAPFRVAVLGSGQSSAEIFLALRELIREAFSHVTTTSAPPRAIIELFLRRTALRPSDDSPFSNEVFDPGMSQAIYRVGAGGSQRRDPRAEVIRQAEQTNYGVVNSTTLEEVSRTRLLAFSALH